MGLAILDPSGSHIYADRDAVFQWLTDVIFCHICFVVIAASFERRLAAFVSTV